MNNAIDILRQQIILIMQLNKLANQHREALKKTDAVEIRQVTGEIEPLLNELAKLEQQQNEMLGKLTMQEWLGTQPPSRERNMVAALLDRLRDQLYQLKVSTIGNRELLRKNIEYVDYNINVMTQTSAGVSYGTPNTQYSGGRPVQGTKMFEANV